MDKTKIKVYVSVLVVVLAVFATVVAGTGIFSHTDRSDGIAIDFEDMKVTWTDLDSGLIDPLGALVEACEANGYKYSIDGDVVTEVNGVKNDANCTWGLWTISKGSLSWTKTADTSKYVSEYEVVSWAYRSDDSVPTVGVDGTGTSIYGYDRPQRTVTIAPSVTETVCSVGASGTVVGTDLYSNYPDAIAERQSSGKITIVGGYTNPSYEMVVKCDPDMVFCYGGQQSHVELAEKLRKVGTDVVVLYEGEDIKTLYDNIYICGVSAGRTSDASVTIGELQYAVGEIENLLELSMSIKETPTMVALSAVKSPWVSGSQTYINDILINVHGKNVYDIEYGWVQVNSETIAQNNPSVIVIVTTDYPATQEAYDAMMSSLSAEWKSTDAYKDGHIYVFCEILGDLSSRPGPRVAQLTEMLARTIHGDAFTDGIEVPNILGDDYEDYLTFTKELDFNE